MVHDWVVFQLTTSPAVAASMCTHGDGTWEDPNTTFKSSYVQKNRAAAQTFFIVVGEGERM